MVQLISGRQMKVWLLNICTSRERAGFTNISFQTKIDFLLQSTSAKPSQFPRLLSKWGGEPVHAKPYFLHLGQTIHFCLNWSKGSRWTQKGTQMVNTLGLTILVPFGPSWTTLERWQACRVWLFLVQNGPFLGHPQSWTVGPKPKVKKGSSPGLLCVAYF